MKNIKKYTLKSIGLIALMLLNYNILQAQNGESCNDPLTFEIGESQEFQFSNNQSEMYFEFQASDDSMLVNILNINQTPYADVSAIRVYAAGDCENLDLFAESIDTASYIAGYLPLLGLSVGNFYLIKVERDVNASLPVAYFDLLVASNYTYPCPNPIPQPCSDLIKNGDFTSATKQNPDHANAFSKNEVCGDWEEYNSALSNVYVYRGSNRSNNGALNNPFVDMLSYKSSNLPFNYNFAVLGNVVDIKAGKNYSLSFELRRSDLTPNSAPTYFKAWFIKSSELSNFSSNSYLAAHLLSLTNNKQEIGSVIPSQTNGNWNLFDFCATANDDYDRIIFFGYHNNITNSNFQIDKISLITLDAGKDVSGVSCDPKAIGPKCIVPGATYQWSPTTGLDFPNTANPIASPTNTTTYTLTMNLPNGCSSNRPSTSKTTISICYPS